MEMFWSEMVVGRPYMVAVKIIATVGRIKYGCGRKRPHVDLNGGTDRSVPYERRA